MNRKLADFENEVLYNVMLGTTTPKVIDSRGHTPLIACLENETIGRLLTRIARAGGCGTIYALSETGRVSLVAVQDRDCIDSEANTLGDDSPIRTLIEHVSTQDDWVLVSGLEMRSYGTAELAKV